MCADAEGPCIIEKLAGKQELSPHSCSQSESTNRSGAEFGAAWQKRLHCFLQGTPQACDGAVTFSVPGDRIPAEHSWDADLDTFMIAT